jgi:hypothetical protein
VKLLRLNDTSTEIQFTLSDALELKRLTEELQVLENRVVPAYNPNIVPKLLSHIQATTKLMLEEVLEVLAAHNAKQPANFYKLYLVAKELLNELVKRMYVDKLDKRLQRDVLVLSKFVKNYQHFYKD